MSEDKTATAEKTKEKKVARQKDAYGFVVGTKGARIAAMLAEGKHTAAEIEVAVTKQFGAKGESGHSKGRFNMTSYLLRKRGFAISRSDKGVLTLSSNS